VPIIVVALLFFVLVAFAGVILLSLALRYRAGTARRQARPWVAKLNVWMTSLSTVFFLSFTLLLSIWAGSAFQYALIGIGAGAIIGLLGVALTRWESRREGLFYTPNRWLAILIVFAIAARVVYGWWRATHPGSPSGGQHWFITASGTQLSLAVAGGLIGYYLVYSIGVRLKIAMASRPSESGVRVLTNVREPRRDNRRTGSALLNSSFLILAWRVCRYVLRHWRRYSKSP
jgi:hypothetical protein